VHAQVGDKVAGEVQETQLLRQRDNLCSVCGPIAGDEGREWLQSEVNEAPLLLLR